MSKRLIATVLTVVFALGISGLTVSGVEGKGKDKSKGKGTMHEEHRVNDQQGQRHGQAHGSFGYGEEVGMGVHDGPTGYLIHGLLSRAAEMELTEGQTRKLKDVELDLDRSRIETEADIEIAELEAQALMRDESSSLSAIEAKLKESAVKQAVFRLASVKARRDAMAILTPEQRQRVKTLQERMREHGKQKHND